MTILLSLGIVVSLAALAVGIVMVLFKAVRPKGKVVVTISVIGIIAFTVAFGLSLDRDARAVGFADHNEMEAAKAAGISDSAVWQANAARRAEAQQAEKAEAERKAAEARQQQERIAQEEKAKREREAEEARAKKEKEEQAALVACRADLQCWGDKYSIDSTIACRPWVERLAKNDFQWIDGMLESKFSRFRWKDKKKGIVTYIGDKIKYQNGFGAWTIHTYQCDFDPATKAVLDVRASPGRLPPS